MRSAGASAGQASGKVTASAQVALSGASPEAIAAHPGWKSSGALRACLDAWETRLKQLSAEIRQISQNLDATVDGYDKAEAQTLADISRAAAGLDGRAK